MIGVYFSVSAFLILSILTYIYFSKKRVENKETIVYDKLLIVTMIGLFLEIITCIWVSIGWPIETTIYKLFAKLTSSYYAVWSGLFLNYLLNVCNYKKERNKWFNISNLIVVLITVLLPVHFKFLNDIIVPQGISIYLTYIICMEYSIIDIIICIKYRKKIVNSKFTPLYALIILGGMAFALAVLYPQLFIIGFVFSLIVIIMYFTIENPDVKMLNELELAKQNAERANEAKTDFLSSMSHEIRTPLNAIVGFSNSILEDETLEEAKTEAKDIIMASQNLLEIVNGILDISKIEAGKMEIVEVEYSLTEVLDNIKKLIIPRIGEKPIELKTNFSKDIPAVLYGDMNKVREIITNLLTNAVKYTEKGIIDISVQCINTKNKSKLIIAVEDTGRGIKPEKIDKLFTKFQRLEEDKNTTLEGTGLGLAITKSLVEMLGGKIVVQSKYGSGSKFTVYLEQKIIKMIEENPTILETENTDEVDYSNKKILIVDDNMLNIKVASRLLRKYQITPDTVLSGDECLDKIKNTTYDLILMDDMMPNKSGTETLQEIKKDKKFKTPVIVLTANAISGMKEKYLKSGFTDYLAKPIDKLELDRVLKENLTKENKTKK